MKLVLIRHGQTAANKDGALDTEAPGKPLNSVGLEQAKELVQQLDEGILPRPDLILTSNLVRTQQTAAPLAAALGLEPQISAGVREIRAGDLEMATDKASVLRYLYTVGAWIKGDLDVRMPGAESGREVLDRFQAALADGFKQIPEDGTLTVFSHGGVIRFIAAMLAPEVSFELVAQNPVPNASFSILTGEPGDWHCETWASRPVGEWPVRPLTEMEKQFAAGSIKPSQEMLEKLQRAELGQQ